ncbi:hypothetical protein XA68_14970 [Ophiocordyceps unilateralis]|uniref:Pathway-specific nitrogen regulator n=1 Tax=Ophiocordyceps unilateralis TaxID=268505 RepID=A0A2A9PM57_OPHUN|nr:hypothetical protein XA68_14970 [Ophiocordyceps unilateralis]
MDPPPHHGQEALLAHQQQPSPSSPDQDTARGRDDGADSSSQHEPDVFSDSSPRSSLGSMSEAEQTKIEQTLSQRGIAQRSRSPRISEPPTSEADDDFVPTIRGTPRLPFRSPSSVQALQRMESPPPAPRLGTSSPRSGRRLGVSGSPQFSPRKTPPRFKRATPPLVLLHVTLLPLAVWPWGAVLDRARSEQLSQEAATLRDAWRHLRNRTGDTVSDRGVLLPHPQADYELLEERLLEALELPLRRRARILECGHYLGPASGDLCSSSNKVRDDDDGDEEEEDDDEDDDDEGEEEEEGGGGKNDKLATHWCRTCRSDIRYDSLGEGKVFRVKVYASNGLMRAGAWAACWKEMERVDVELEPIVETSLHDELARLDEELSGLLGEHDGAEELEESEDIDGENYRTSSSATVHRLVELDSPTSTPRPLDASPLPRSSEPQEESTHGRPTPHNADISPVPPRRRRPAPDGTASLPDLLLEAVRVLIHDRKNVVIAFLSTLILMLAVTPRLYPLTTTTTPVAETLRQSLVTASASLVNEKGTVEAVPRPEFGPEGTPSAAVDDPCASCSLAAGAVEVTVRLVETVTVTRTETETVTAGGGDTSSPAAFVSAEHSSVSTKGGSVSLEIFAVTASSVPDENASLASAEHASVSVETDAGSVESNTRSLPPPTTSSSAVKAAEALAALKPDYESPALLESKAPIRAIDLDFHEDL